MASNLHLFLTNLFSSILGKPLPNVTWWSGKKLIDSSFTQAPHGNIRNELFIRNLNRSEFLLQLTCKSSNTNLTSPVESSVTIDMNCKWQTFLPTHKIQLDQI